MNVSSSNYLVSGNDIVLLAIPEPNSGILLLGGLGLLIFAQRMRRSFR